MRTTMRKRALALGLSLVLCMSLMSTAAFATEGTNANVTDMSISGAVNTMENGNFVMTLPGTTMVTACTLTVTADTAINWNPTPHATNDLYVSNATEDSVTLNFDINENDVDLNGSIYALTLTPNADKTVWTGTFGNGFNNTSLANLATMFGDREVQLAPDAIGEGSQARRFLVNQYGDKVAMALCVPDAAIYTVTYHVNDITNFSVKLAAGMTIPEPVVTLASNQTLDGWYEDASYTTALVSGTTASKDMDIYAKVTTAPLTEEETMIAALEARETVEIDDLTTWEIFVRNAEKAQPGGLVKLTGNIDCQNATYDPLDFAGNFDGGNKTISNATFRSIASSYNSSSENDIYCSGLFASIGPGQIIANLKLDHITAQSSQTYAGVLAGLVDGSGSNRALIQNIQVSNSSATGRSAAGVTGFLRNATVKYCSSKTTTITGVANGGGIVGINNAVVSNCYSTTSPTALTIMGGKKGGVVSKDVRGGRAEYCWATMKVVGDESDGGGACTFILDSVNSRTTASAFDTAGFKAPVWNVVKGTGTTFFENEVEYDFTASES